MNIFSRWWSNGQELSQTHLITFLSSAIILTRAVQTRESNSFNLKIQSIAMLLLAPFQLPRGVACQMCSTGSLSASQGIYVRHIWHLWQKVIQNVFHANQGFYKRWELTLLNCCTGLLYYLMSGSWAYFKFSFLLFHNNGITELWKPLFWLSACHGIEVDNGVGLESKTWAIMFFGKGPGGKVFCLTTTGHCRKPIYVSIQR